MNEIIEIDNELINLSLENNIYKSEIRRYNTKISFNDFFKNNLLKNEPCIFDSWLTKDWLASKEWVDEDGTPDCQYLSEKFGFAEVPVADCNQKHFDSQKKEKFLFREYIDYFKQRRIGVDERCLYLKDWHFTKDFPLYKSYRVPSFFSSDWLNEFWVYRNDELDDDYKFVYMGPQGSWTPFHADVFRSFSWSANICGKKRWIFYPPSEYLFLKDKYGNLIYDVESAELKDLSMFPKADKAKGKIEVIQDGGETIFVPSQWHHQVYNLSDTISINHNWINGTNIECVLQYFLCSLREVEDAISDCRGMDDWVSQCQLILKSTHGMDVKEFFYFLKVIADRRIKYLKGDFSVSSFPELKFGKNLVVFDVKKLISVFRSLQDELCSDTMESLDEFCNFPHILEELEQFF